MTARDSRRCCGWKGLRMLLVVVVVVLVLVLVIGIRPPPRDEEEEEETEAPGAMDALRRGAPPMLGRMAGGSVLTDEGREGVPVLVCCVVWHG